MARRNWSPGPNLAADQLLRDRPSTRDASLYNARPLLRDLHHMLLEVIQLISIPGYEAYVCVRFFMYKTLCAAFIWLPWDARSCLYVCLYWGGGGKII